MCVYALWLLLVSLFIKNTAICTGKPIHSTIFFLINCPTCIYRFFYNINLGRCSCVSVKKELFYRGHFLS